MRRHKISATAAAVIIGIIGISNVSFCATEKADETYPPRPFPIKKDFKWGLMDATGKVLVEPQFARFGEPTEGLIWYATRSEGPVGYMDYHGKVVISPRYGMAHEFSEGYAWASDSGRPSNDFETVLDGKYGVIDKTGTFVLEAKYYHRGTPFYRGLSLADAVVRGNVQEVIDPHGRKRASLNQRNGFESWTFSEGFLAITSSGYGMGSARSSAGFLDSGYRMVFMKFRGARPFSEGLAAVQDKKTGKWGYINKTGRYVIKPRFDHATEFSFDVAAVTVNGDPGNPRWGRPFKKVGWSYIDKKGRPAVVSRNAFRAGPFRDDRAALLLTNEGFGLDRDIFGDVVVIDRSGDTIFELKSASMDPYCDGLARVRVYIKNVVFKVGYVDRDGTWVHEPVL